MTHDAPHEPDAASSAPSPGEVLVDLLVFAPIGAAVEGVRLVQRQRVELAKQVEQARALGSFVVPLVRRHGWSMVRSLVTSRTSRTGAGTTSKEST